MKAKIFARKSFTPLLPGARLPDRLISCLGAALGIAAAAGVGTLLTPTLEAAAFLVAPMGASAVLIFAIPASPLAQPWPVVGGHLTSVVVGFIIAAMVQNPVLAAGVAVGGAILAMSLLRCLHPPGGGSALLPLLGGAGVQEGLAYAATPVTLNAVMLVLVGWLFHQFSSHEYPRLTSVSRRDVQFPTMVHGDDIDAALAELGEALDVRRDDLELLFRSAERHAAHRRRG